MADSLSTIRTRIKGRLDTISGLTNFKQEPDAIPQAPFTILGDVAIDYGTDMGGGMNYSARLFLAVGERDSDAAWTQLDSYLASSGTKSIPAALEGASGAAPAVGDFCLVTRAEHIGHVAYRGRTMIGAEFIIKSQSGG